MELNPNNFGIAHLFDKGAILNMLLRVDCLRGSFGCIGLWTIDLGGS